jgi:hypothetical protein
MSGPDPKSAEYADSLRPFFVKIEAKKRFALFPQAQMPWGGAAEGISLGDFENVKTGKLSIRFYYSFLPETVVKLHARGLNEGAQTSAKSLEEVFHPGLAALMRETLPCKLQSETLEIRVEEDLQPPGNDQKK